VNAPTPAPRVNRRVFATFAGLLTAFVLAVIAWDVWLYARTGDGSETISWSVVLVTAANPGLAFLFGFVTGGLVCGLASHFWFGLPSPRAVVRLAELEAQRDSERAERIKAQETIQALFDHGADEDAWPPGTHYVDALGPFVAGLRARLADLEAGIRHVVTREADDICWMDAYTSLAHLVGLTFDPLLIPADRMLANCGRFVADLHAGRPYGVDRLTEELGRLRGRVAELEAEVARLREPAGERRPEPPGLTWETYNR
jgi:hypothetical protein